MSRRGRLRAVWLGGVALAALAGAFAPSRAQNAPPPVSLDDVAPSAKPAPPVAAASPVPPTPVLATPVLAKPAPPASAAAAPVAVVPVAAPVASAPVASVPLATAAPPAATPAAGPGISTWINADFATAQTTNVAAAPSEDAAVLSQLRQGAQVRVVGEVAGTQWLKIKLQDDSVGYVPAAAIPAATGMPGATGIKEAASSAVGASGEVSGRAHVRDTATLVVDGERVHVAGIAGAGGSYARAMQGFVDASGGRLVCTPTQAGGDRCTLPSGADLAAFALVNGAARVTPGAPDSYQAQEDVARAAHRGLWAEAAPPPPVAEAPPPEEMPADDPPPPAPDFTVVDGEPEVIVTGVTEALVYDDDDGWGYWDPYHHWHGAPHGWSHRLEHMYPGGRGLRDMGLHGRFDHDGHLDAGRVDRGHVDAVRLDRDDRARFAGHAEFAAPGLARADARPGFGAPMPGGGRPSMPMPFHGAAGGAPFRSGGMAMASTRPGMPMPMGGARPGMPMPMGGGRAGMPMPRAAAFRGAPPHAATPARCHGKGC